MGESYTFLLMMKKRFCNLSTLALSMLLLIAGVAPRGFALQAAQQTTQQTEPETPTPQTPSPATPAKIPTDKPCFDQIFESQQGHERADRMGANSVLASSYPIGGLPKPCGILAPVIAPITAPINWYARFLTGPQVKPLTPAEKAHLAARNVIDPFNALTILGESAIGVGSDSHSPYGPGMPGFGRDVGVTYTEDMTGEFFNTFLIPSIVHQDPHYHRMPKATIARRVLHTATEVVWTVGDNGHGMLNYGTLVGNAIDDEIANLYVPGRQTNLPASAQRYGVSLALAPVDNLVTEFLPDIARRIHIRDVFIQGIINQVAKTNQ
jgi:hypothetical protein